MRAACVSLLALAAALATPALGAPMTDGERNELMIDSGRVSVMMREARDALPTITAPDRPSPADTPAGIRSLIFDNLVSSVHDYNALAYTACHDGILSGELCKGPYLPRWLTAGAARFSDEQLHAMEKETMDRLQPFWAAICAKAPERADGQDVCPME